jgi:hypothetical protein
MKFSTPVFALVAASTVCANNTESLINFLKKRDVALDESAFEDVSLACSAELNKYTPCFQTPSRLNSDEECQLLISDECKNFVSNAQSLVPSCKDYPKVMEFINPKILEGTYSVYVFTCAKDEAGRPCPLATDFANEINKQGTTLTRTQAEKDLMDTCSSNACRIATHDAYQKLFGSALNAYEDLSTTSGSFSKADTNSMQALLDFLNSDECKAMSGSSSVGTSGGALNGNTLNGNTLNGSTPNGSTLNGSTLNGGKTNASSANSSNGNAPDANSGSSTLKIGTGLFVSLGLLLLSLY